MLIVDRGGNALSFRQNWIEYCIYYYFIWGIWEIMKKLSPLINSYQGNVRVLDGWKLKNKLNLKFKVSQTIYGICNSESRNSNVSQAMNLNSGIEIHDFQFHNSILKSQMKSSSQ